MIVKVKTVETRTSANGNSYDMVNFEHTYVEKDLGEVDKSGKPTKSKVKVLVPSQALDTGMVEVGEWVDLSAILKDKELRKK